MWLMVPRRSCLALCSRIRLLGRDSVCCLKGSSLLDGTDSVTRRRSWFQLDELFGLPMLFEADQEELFELSPDDLDSKQWINDFDPLPPFPFPDPLPFELLILDPDDFPPFPLPLPSILPFEPFMALEPFLLFAFLLFRQSVGFLVVGALCTVGATVGAVVFVGVGEAVGTSVPFWIAHCAWSAMTSHVPSHTFVPMKQPDPGFSLNKRSAGSSAPEHSTEV